MIVMKSVWNKFYQLVDIFALVFDTVSPACSCREGCSMLRDMNIYFNLFPGLYIAGSCDTTPMSEWSLEKVIVTKVFDLDKNISQSSI